MKIKSLTLKNIFSFGEVPQTFEFENLNLLIGPNNHGKSNVLRALNVAISSIEGINHLGLNIQKNFTLEKRFGKSNEQFFHDGETTNSEITIGVKIPHKIKMEIGKDQTIYPEGIDLKTSFSLNGDQITGNLEEIWISAEENQSVSLKSLYENSPDTNTFTKEQIDKTTHLNFTKFLIFSSDKTKNNSINQIIDSYNASLSKEKTIDYLVIYNKVIRANEQLNFFDLPTKRNLEDFIHAEENLENTTEKISKLRDGDFESRKKYKEIIELSRKLVFPHTEVGEIELTFPNDPNDHKRKYLKINEGRKSHDLSVVGSGAEQIFALCSDILQEKSGSMIAVEEPETHLHPDLQRKLIGEIIDFSKKYNYQFFVTTHSPVFLQFFSKEENATIHKIEMIDGSSKIELDNEGYQALKATGSMPSDLLITNGIIWVEGPSDAIYISKWINLFHEENIDTSELVHPDNLGFEFDFYGGSILKNYQFDEFEDQKGDVIKEKLINSIKINHNAFIVFDRDEYKEKNTETKEKNKKECIKELHAHCKKIDPQINEEACYWMTKSKEIEDYIPEKKAREHKVFKKEDGKSLIHLTGSDIIYENGERINSVKIDPDKNKTKLAEVLTKELTYNDWFGDKHTGKDLQKQIQKLIRRICEWNEIDWREIEGLKE